MKKQICIISMVFAVAGTLGLIVGCNQKAADQATSGQPHPRIQENVDLAPGKPIAPQDQAKVSSIAMKALVHISRAQQEIAAKNIAEAKKDVAQAASLMAILKEILPTVKVIDSIQVAMANLTYVNTTEVPQDLVTITASLDQLNDLLPEGKAKEQAKQAKGALAKDKEKGAAKAKEVAGSGRGIARFQRSGHVRFSRLPLRQIGPGRTGQWR